MCALAWPAAAILAMAGRRLSPARRCLGGNNLAAAMQLAYGVQLQPLVLLRARQRKELAAAEHAQHAARLRLCCCHHSAPPRRRARDFLHGSLIFDKPVQVSFFETTIRLLGGLVSCYDLSGDRRVQLRGRGGRGGCASLSRP